uniref:Uncharacterized protein n=1 Tax=Myripristis murdjan TaxID=586833 RepID=A0A667YUQ1_9TELE
RGFGESHVGGDYAPVGIIEKGHGDGVFAGRQPVPLGGWVDLEDMSSGAEDGLLPSMKKMKKKEVSSLLNIAKLQRFLDKLLQTSTLVLSVAFFNTIVTLSDKQCYTDTH